jgi:hypothetical protein
MQALAADVEYACRTAGAMDAVLLAGDAKLKFFKAPEKVSAGPWTLFALLQYLGEWLVITRNTDPSLNKEAFAVRDAFLRKISPGKTAAVFVEKDWRIELCPMVRSDHAAYIADGEINLAPGQIISLRVSNRDKGIMVEDMALVKESGTELLTDL